MKEPQMKNPVHLLAFGFGSGLMPWAPGTFGTLAAEPFYLVMAQLPLAGYLAALVLVILAGIPICGRTSRDLGVHDHGGIVWDEFAGFFLTMTAVPLSWQWVVAGFLLFRLFDILKPWPIGWLDRRVGGGVGIMLDDLLAGGFAWLALQLLIVVS
jgi:phosphatidylglycerophosphatase A